MSRFRGSRRLTIAERNDMDANGVAHLNYVLRRYGGLDVYIPRIETDPTTAPCPGAPPVVAPTVAPTTSQSTVSASQHPRPAGPLGNFTPLFGGRIVLGPEKSLFFLSIFLLLLIMLLIIIEKEVIENIVGGLGGTAIFYTGIILCSLSITTFLRVGITDPGVVPRNYSLQELVAETTDFRARHPHNRFYRYCRKCRAFRPPRTFHCSRCEICIRQQDLHFFPGGMCIGERNRRFFCFTVLYQTLLGIWLISTHFIINFSARKLAAKTRPFETEKSVMALIGLLAGLMIFFLPQSGILMFIYRIYLISVGRTAREEYRKFRYYDLNDCVVDRRPICTNIFNFFFRPSLPSAFRRRGNRIDPESMQAVLPTQWNLEQILGRQRVIETRDLNANVTVDINANEVPTTEIDEAARLRELADFARGRSTPSVPLFEQEVNHPTTRIKMPRKSKQSSIIQQQIFAFQEARYMPRATVSNHKRNKLPVTLSDGCIPRTQDGVQEMIQLARATQLRRIIQMILLRDRTGLVDMSSRVNIAALVGMNRFDPDNLQLLELNNGLPMIAPRRREVDQGVNQPRLGAGVLGIPQMVAAGLLPTARDIANSVESMVGRGRIRRLPPVGRQRYIPITVVDPPLARRPMNEADFRNFAGQRATLNQLRVNGGATSRGTSPPTETTIPVPATTVTDNISSQSPPVAPAAQPLQTNIFPVAPGVLDQDINNNNNTLPYRNFIIGQSPIVDSQPTTTALPNTAVTSVSNISTRSPPSQTTVLRPFPQNPGHMVVIPIFSDSD